MNELNKAIEQLHDIKNYYGIGAVFFAILIGVILFALYKYIGRAAERAAEESSEENLKKFQAHIDKELVKFQTKHQKQVDAVHETFQKFQKLTGMINFAAKGEKYTTPMDINDEVRYLVQFRREFKDIYNENRLIFPIELCEKIDELFPIVDKWLDTFIGGILPRAEEEEEEEEEEEVDTEGPKTYLAGVWSVNAFDEIDAALTTVREEIETEFRKIYGTNQ